ncbi:integrase catalytic domain-containing protein [Nesterenkonia salmonea]|nr:DDE-type integrase/transposase/recombinase [Nesterenkonia salmonea]
MAARRQVAQRLAIKYQKATKAEKKAILDDLCQVNGWHRDHARKVLRQTTAGPPTPRKPRAPAVKYTEEVIDALRFCWAVLDGPTGKRLAPALPGLVESLRRHGELHINDQTAALLISMSPATIDRRLAPDRAAMATTRGNSLTKPGSLLKSQIPMRTWSDWDNSSPGFLEVDLVGHDGGDLNGEFCYTLTCTDIATGWTENRTIRNKAAKWVFTALIELQAQFPFPILGIDSDNGSEFINHHLLRWCTEAQITFTRSRPNNKNDGAHVEQKNWATARRIAGYWRYETPSEMRLLNQIWAIHSPLLNLFTPSQKLLTKTRTGAKTAKTYDTAMTPYQRLQQRARMYPEALDTKDEKILKEKFTRTNPAELRREIGTRQAELLTKVRRKNITQRNKRNAAYLNRAKLNESTTHTSRAS